MREDREEDMEKRERERKRGEGRRERGREERYITDNMDLLSVC